MKQRIPKAIYSKELREQAVKLVTEEGLSAKEAAVAEWINAKSRQ